MKILTFFILVTGAALQLLSMSTGAESIVHNTTKALKDSTIYIGAYGGQTQTSISLPGIDDYFNAAGYDSTVSYDDVATYSLVVGVDINDYSAIEFSYSDFGKPSSDEIGDIENTALTVGVIGKWPIKKTVFPYVKLGVTSWDTEDNSGTKVGGTDFMAGVGMFINVYNNWKIDLRYEYYQIEISNASITSDTTAKIELQSGTLGITYNFSP